MPRQTYGHTDITTATNTAATIVNITATAAAAIITTTSNLSNAHVMCDSNNAATWWAIVYSMQ